MNQSDTSAVILAGGTAARLGHRDKSAIAWRGHSFLHHIMERIRPQVAAVAINAPLRGEHFPRDAVCLPDPWPDQRGPLAGMLAGLEWSPTPWTLFVPCDNPQPPSDLRQLLAAGMLPSAGGAPALGYATCAGDHHYLYALVPKHRAASLRLYLESGQRSVAGWYRQEHASAVPFADTSAFLNVNTPAELASLRSLE